jgi:uncharacterized protein (DUF433 family)
MSKTYVITLRLPEALGVDVERFAARHGHKPAQLGAWLVEEGVRRRKHPLIDLRETSGGRVAYVHGTRFAVHWIVGQVRGGNSVEDVAREFDLPKAQVLAALAYAEAYPDEIEADLDRSRDNLEWIRQQDAAWCAGHKAKSRSTAKPKRNGKARQ